MAGRLRWLVFPRIQQQESRVAKTDDIVTGAVATGEIIQELIAINTTHFVVSAHVENRFLRRAIFAQLRERPADDIFRQKTAVHIARQHEEIARLRISGLQHLAENLMLLFQIELQIRREEEGIFGFHNIRNHKGMCIAKLHLRVMVRMNDDDAIFVFRARLQAGKRNRMVCPPQALALTLMPRRLPHIRADLAILDGRTKRIRARESDRHRAGIRIRQPRPMRQFRLRRRLLGHAAACEIPTVFSTLHMECQQVVALLHFKEDAMVAREDVGIAVAGLPCIENHIAIAIDFHPPVAAHANHDRAFSRRRKVAVQNAFRLVRNRRFAA